MSKCKIWEGETIRKTGQRKSSASINITWVIFVFLADKGIPGEIVSDQWKLVNVDFKFQLRLPTSYVDLDGLFLLSEPLIVFSKIVIVKQLYNLEKFTKNTYK